jgi:hypothetical protein
MEEWLRPGSSDVQMLHLFNSSGTRVAFVLLIAVVLAAGIYATRARRRQQAVVGSTIAAAEPESPQLLAEPIAVLDFEEAPGRVPIYKSRVVIGRHREDDVKVNDIRVSRHHALLVHSDGDGFEIHNQTAARSEPNDLLVNGIYREHAKLTNGDKVTVGGVSFVFRTVGLTPAHAA